MQTRDLVIDRIRGALVILMVAGNYLAGVNWIPAFIKHAPDIGFTLSDTVAPIFVFVMALNFAPSFERHSRNKTYDAYRYFSLRYLSLIGIGAIVTAGSVLVDRSSGWGVLEALGVAGLLTMLVIKLPTLIRVLVGLATLGAYQYFLDNGMLQRVLHSGHGGLFGAVSWTALLILSTAVADYWRKGMKHYLVCLGVLMVATGLAAAFIPISKNRVSMSYILISLLMSAVIFLVVKLFSKNVKDRAGLLCWWGQNALAMYAFHLLLLGFFGLPNASWWYADAPLWLVALQLAAIYAILTFIARRIFTGAN